MGRIPQPFVIAHGTEQAQRLRGAVLAIGNFDGVHRGHRAVFGTAIRRAQAAACPAAALTFEPHPRNYFRPDEPSFRLTDQRTKLRLLASSGLDGVVVLKFDGALANLTADEFVEDILVDRLAVGGVVVGFNFFFGKNRGGSPEVLAAAGARHGFSVDIVPPFEEHGRRVSSGAVRAALARGDVTDAAALLGYPWFVSGTVIHGEKRGRELGYPTANLRLDPGCDLKHGIYAVRVAVEGRHYDAVASFGRRPTFDNGAPLLEVFLFDFDGDLYGKMLDVAFIGWIRPELRFEGIEALVRQMDDDSSAARSILAASSLDFPPLHAPPS
jgi:riboflavin kinase / FMN adenylyltransferase